MKDLFIASPTKQIPRSRGEAMDHKNCRVPRRPMLKILNNDQVTSLKMCKLRTKDPQKKKLDEAHEPECRHVCWETEI